MLRQSLTPDCPQTSLKIVIIGVAALSIMLILRFLAVLRERDWDVGVMGLVWLSFLVLTPIGMWRLTRWGRILGMITLWLAAFAFLGAISAARLIDLGPHENQAVSLAWELMKFAPITILALAGLHILGKYKTAFGRNANAVAIGDEYN